MGTLSGGGTEQVTIGERCLLGANAGIGISLGDDCVVEAGLLRDRRHAREAPRRLVVKGKELSGISGMMFIRHSQTGAVEARHAPATGAALNAALHVVAVVSVRMLVACATSIRTKTRSYALR